MNLKLTFLLSAVFICVFSYAQNIHFGVTADVNVTKMNAKGLSSKSLAGYDGGVFANVGLAKKWSLQPELLYTLKTIQKSSDFETYYVNDGRSFASTNINLNYLTVPVLINYHISKSFRVNVGPQYSRLIYSNDDLQKDDKSAFKRNEVGVTAGVQYVFSPSFNVFANLYRSVTDNNNIDNRYHWYNNQLRVGINIGIL